MFISGTNKQYMLLSIITINKNNEVGLARTLNSLRVFRNYINVEFIFVDSVSNDSSLEIASRFYKINEILSEEDEGRYDGMNKGLFKAKGEFILWLNSGDELINGCEEIIIQQLDGTQFDVISFNSQLRCENTNSLQGIHKLQLPTHVKMLSVPHQSTFYRRSSCLKINGFSNLYRSAGDLDFNFRLLLDNNKFIHVDKNISIFYTGGISSTIQGGEEALRIYKKYGYLTTLEFLKGIIFFRLLGPIKQKFKFKVFALFDTIHNRSCRPGHFSALWLYRLFGLQSKSKLPVHCYIEAPHLVVIGENNSIRSLFFFTPNRYTDKKKLIIGNSNRIGRNVVFRLLSPLVIGDNCVIGNNVYIFDHYEGHGEIKGIFDEREKSGQIEIGSRVNIGDNCQIGPGTKIHDGQTVPAGETLIRSQVIG